jgi:hypothetical protein
MGLLGAVVVPVFAQESAPKPMTPVAAVERMLKAVADSSHGELALAWGSNNGPAVRTQPQEWQKRVAIIQSFLQKASYRIIGEDASAPGGNVRTVLVEQRRPTCLKTMPFITTQMGDKSWLVTSVDLAAGVPPGKTCESDQKGAAPKPN